jgi:hypothetical protein
MRTGGEYGENIEGLTRMEEIYGTQGDLPSQKNYTDLNTGEKDTEWKQLQNLHLNS